MTVVGKTVRHCHGKKGIIKRHKTHKKALAQHRAIMASEKGKKKR